VEGKQFFAPSPEKTKAMVLVIVWRETIFVEQNLRGNSGKKQSRKSACGCGLAKSDCNPCNHCAARPKAKKAKRFRCECHRLGRPGERSEQAAQCRDFAWHANERSPVTAKSRNAAGG
jgi:hypothetical protein